MTPVAVDVDAGAQKHPLGVVTAALGLADCRGAVRGQGGKQHAGLDLGRSDGQLVGDRAQVCAAYGQRWKAAIGRVELRPHLAQRDSDAIDRAPADRLVAVERKGASLLRGQPARQQAHQSAGVADVDRTVWFARLAQARAADHDLAAVLAATHLHERPKSAHGLKRGGCIRGMQIALDPHGL